MSTAIDHTATVRAPTRAVAVVSIDSDHAIVVKNTDDGVAVTDIKRRRPEDLSYLVRIVDEIGPRERVTILGPDDLRVELEREYVTVYHRPDVLIDVETGPAETARQLIARVVRLAA